MNKETLDNIKIQLEEDYIDFGIHDEEEIELLITMVKTYENWKALKEWLDINTYKVHSEDDLKLLESVISKMNELEKENGK